MAAATAEGSLIGVIGDEVNLLKSELVLTVHSSIVQRCTGQDGPSYTSPCASRVARSSVLLLRKEVMLSRPAAPPPAAGHCDGILTSWSRQR